jgi:hypothetical protein
MKNILLFALCYCVASCKPAATPPQNIVQSHSQPNITAVVDTARHMEKNKEEDSEDSTPKITCDVKANLIEKFQQSGVLLERLSFTEGSDKQPEWIKISVPNQPCKIVDITNASHLFYKLEDWDKDGFVDILEIHARAATFNVHWFDKTKNDFIEIDKQFGGGCESFDASKSLFIDANDNAELRYNYDFKNDYTLFYFKKGVFKPLGQVTFFIDGHQKDDKLSVIVKKYKSPQDQEGTTVATTAFNALAPKAETLHKQRVSEEETYSQKYTTKMSDEQRKNLTKQYEQNTKTIETLHTEWTAIAKPMVIQYWKDNLATFLVQ